MKLTTWNCNGAYRNKPHIDSDITVIQECDKLAQPEIWTGDKNGIGIFSEFDLRLHYSYNPDFKYVLPIIVEDFTLFAIWAMNDRINRKNRYISQVVQALKYYEKLLREPTIIIGDFNWNLKWDTKPSGPILYKWADLIELLGEKRITSTYHKYLKEDFGKETQPTFYQFKDKSKPYHIDYCFVSEHFKISKVGIGKYADWIQYSDHVPLTVELERINA